MPLDIRGQVLAGIKAYLTPRLAPLVAPDAILTAFPTDVDLVKRIGAGVDAVNPLVALLLGDERPSPDQSARGGPVAALGPVALPSRTATALIADGRAQAPLTIVVVAGGAQGEKLRGMAAQLIRGVLTTAVSIPIPDEVFVATYAYTYQLETQLLWASGREDDREAEARLWRYDLVYTARYPLVHPEGRAVIADVRVSTLIGR